MELIFHRSKHFLHSIVDTIENESQAPASSLKVLHQPLIVRNVSIANRIQSIHRIKVPSKCGTTLKLLQDNFKRTEELVSKTTNLLDRGFYKEVNHLDRISNTHLLIFIVGISVSVLTFVIFTTMLFVSMSKDIESLKNLKASKQFNEIDRMLVDYEVRIEHLENKRNE